jgi:hypothetical protein
MNSQRRNRIQNFNFSDIIENSEIKKQTIGNHGNEKEIQVVERN